MNNLLTKSRLIAGICLFIPVAYAEPDFSNQGSIEQVEYNYPNTVFSSTENHSSGKSEVELIQLGDNNEAVVDVNGKNNQIGLTQVGNNNNGDIQLDGDRNKLSTLQNGDGLSFGLQIDGNNRAYTLTQEKH